MAGSNLAGLAGGIGKTIEFIQLMRKLAQKEKERKNRALSALNERFGTAWDRP